MKTQSEHRANHWQLDWVIDPLCGWSYGALPLLHAVADKWPTRQRLLPGGLFVSPHRRWLDNDWRQHVLQHDARIAQLSGMTFGADYQARMQDETPLLLDSLPASRGLLALQQSTPSLALPWLTAVQQAWYVEGRDIAQMTTLTSVATQLGLTSEHWLSVWQSVTDAQVLQAIQQAGLLMQRTGAQGFPSAILWQQDSATLLPVQRFYGDSRSWMHYLDTVIPTTLT